MIDLSKELKEVNRLKVKAHLELRLRFEWEEPRNFLLARIFSEILDNRAFWQTLLANNFFPCRGLVEYYDKIQWWYNQFSKQDRGKNEWLEFKTYEWKDEKIEFSEFYRDDYLLVGHHLHQVAL